MRYVPALMAGTDGNDSIVGAGGADVIQALAGTTGSSASGVTT
jgi:hypothetical protein